MSTGKNQISGKTFISKLMSFSVSTWMGFLISFFATPIITRFFIPAEIGKINLFMTYMNLLVTACYLGLDQTYVRFYSEPPKNQTEKQVLTFCIKYSLICCFIVCSIVLIFYKKISYNISESINLLIPLCLVLTIISNIILRYSNLKYRMEQRVVLYSVQAITLIIITKILYVAGAFINPIHVYAITTTTFAFIITAVIFSIMQFKSSIDLKTNMQKENKYILFKYALPLMPITLLSMLNNSMAILMLKHFVDYSAIGIYTSAVSICGIIGLLQSGFNIYWWPFVFENYKENRDKIQKVHLYITFLMVAFGICIVLGQDVLYMLLGEKFRSSKEFFPFLLLSPICYTIAETTGVGINISKKSYLNIITFVANTLTNFVLCLILLPKIGLLGAAISAGSAAIVMLLVKTFIAEKYYRCISNYVKSFIPLVIMIIVAISNVVFFNYIIIKYSIFIVCLVVLVIIYRKETKNLCNIAFEILTSLHKKRSI